MEVYANIISRLINTGNHHFSLTVITDKCSHLINFLLIEILMLA